MKKEDVKYILEKNARVLYFDRSTTMEELEQIAPLMKQFNPGYEYFRQAIIASVTKDLSQALVNCDEAINIGFVNNDIFLIQEVSMFMGVINRSIGANEDALMNYITVLKYGANPRAYNNIADIYMTIGAFDEGRDYLEKALALLLKKESLNLFDERLLNIVYTNLSETDLNTGRIHSGIERAGKCIEMSRALNDVFTEAFGFSLLGIANMKLKDYEVALDNFQRARSLYDGCDELSQNRVFDYIEENIRYVADCYFQWGKYDEALKTLTDIKGMIASDYEMQINIWTAKNNKQKCLEAYMHYFDFMKDMELTQKKNKIDHFITKMTVFETEKKANDYELLYNHTRSVSNIGREIIAAQKLDDVLSALYAHIDKIMDFNTLALAIVQDEKIHYNWVMENHQKIEGFDVPVDNRNSFSSWVVRNKKSIRLNDALTYEETLKYKDQPGQNVYGDAMGSMLISPIIYKNKVYGIINVQSNNRYVYSEYDLEVIKMLGSFIAVAMKNWQDNELLKEANEKLEVLSKTDALTGISNRHVLSEIVENLFIASEGNNRISVVMIDIDHFKEYNDTYGHIDGDRCIIKIVDALRTYLDVGNFRLFRYGGDEFAAIVPFIDSDAVFDLLEEARQAIEELGIPNSKSSVSDYVTCTFGYTTVTKGGIGYQRAFYLADEALYTAKADGKNRIAFKEE